MKNVKLVSIQRFLLVYVINQRMLALRLYFFLFIISTTGSSLSSQSWNSRNKDSIYNSFDCLLREQRIPELLDDVSQLIEELSQASDSSVTLGILYHYKGRAEQSIGQFTQSLISFRTALELYGDDTEEHISSLYYQMANNFLYSSRDSVIAYCNKGLKLERMNERPDKLLMARMNSLLGFIHIYSKEFDIAKSYFKKSQDLLDESDNPDKIEASAKLLFNTALMHYNNQEFQYALHYYKRSYNLACKLFGSQSISALGRLNSIAIVYSRLGEKDRSVSIYKEIVKNLLSSSHPNYRSLQTLYNNIAVNYYRLKKYPEAIQYLDTSFHYLKKIGPINKNHRSYHSKVIDKISCYLEIGNLFEAERLLSELGDINETIIDGTRYSQMIMDEIMIHSRYLFTTKKYDTAIDYIIRRIDFIRNLGDGRDPPINYYQELQSLNLWAAEGIYKKYIGHKSMEGLEQALPYLEEHLSLLRKRQALFSEIADQQRISSESRKALEMYLDIISRSPKTNKEEVLLRALYEVEYVKNIQLNQRIRLKKMKKDHNLKSIVDTLSLLQKNLFQLEEKGTQSSRDSVFALKQAIYGINDSLNTLLTIQSDGLLSVPKLDLKEIRSKMSEQGHDAVLISFLGEENLFYLKISQTDFKLIKRDSTFIRIPSQLKSHFSSTDNLQGKVIMVIENIYDTPLRRQSINSTQNLSIPSPSLLSSLSTFLADSTVISPDDRNVLLIQDGWLNFIPYASLIPDFEAHNDRVSYHRQLPFLVWSKSFNYEYALSTYLYPIQSYDYNQTYLGLAPYAGNNNVSCSNILDLFTEGTPTLPLLDYSLDEVKSARATLGGSIFISSEATKNAFYKHAAESRILHLATHGYSQRVKNYDQSGMYLYHESCSYDSLVLKQSEIIHENIPAELLILSSCDSGNGMVHNGEGVISLARSFRMAGVQSILMNRWEITDFGSSSIVKQFLENLKEGQSKDMSLTMAKRKFLNNVEDQQYLHPKYWSGMVLIGNNSPIHLSDSDTLPIHLIFGGLLACILISLVFLYVGKFS